MAAGVARKEETVMFVMCLAVVVGGEQKAY